MSFCTAINCMDGRTQLPVNAFLRKMFGVDYVDTITEPAPVRILAEEPDSPQTESILSRVKLSINKHGSQHVAVVAHYDCTGNPAGEKEQKEQLDLAVRFVAAQDPGVHVLGVWVDSTGTVSQVCQAWD